MSNNHGGDFKEIGEHCNTYLCNNIGADPVWLLAATNIVITCFLSVCLVNIVSFALAAARQSLAELLWRRPRHRAPVTAAPQATVSHHTAATLAQTGVRCGEANIVGN